jgi:hypothetical protein
MTQITLTPEMPVLPTIIVTSRRYVTKNGHTKECTTYAMVVRGEIITAGWLENTYDHGRIYNVLKSLYDTGHLPDYYAHPGYHNAPLLWEITEAYVDSAVRAVRETQLVYFTYQTLFTLAGKGLLS